MELKDFDHKVIAKHFNLKVDAMLKLKKSYTKKNGSGHKWILFVKSYLYDMSKI